MKLKPFAALVCTFVVAGFAARAEIKTEPVEYKQGDATLRGFLAYDDAVKGKRPAVLIMHQYMGITPFEQDVAKRLAQKGYVAFAADIYGTAAHPTTPKEASAAMVPFIKDRALWRARGEAALKTLLANDRVDASHVGVIGYCFGGGSALELDRDGAPVLATVIFHGVLATPNPADAKNIKGHILALQGGDDPLVPQKDVDAFEAEMRAAHVDWQMVQYGGAKHAYTVPAAGNKPGSPVAYNAEADHRSWIAMTDFFNEYLTQP